MKCPHCGIACHESWDYKQISPEEEPIGEIKGSLGEFRGVSGGSFGDRLRNPETRATLAALSSLTIGAGSWVEPIEIHNYGVYTQEDT